ncbi:periplasmic chaperone for outer membrane proteins SurA [Arcticibacter pallidicorallinus]|uniref:Periplasmic chaperone for outer membrane proteins SurA n=1 Tax=Arcticibacter pallidicorallinus TaxID=1259464 RepID=A0A2T0TT52_9SPHI|nr:peptidylprolyl isomerase [Arcticibacter pallidicorallinus]PRY48874.1 periplasmic chaperone for outer membrane proteins SurA [Arcticibacter pallidicorallinus]
MKQTVGILFFLLTSINLTFAQNITVNKIAAVVGDNIILQSDIEREYANYILQGNPQNDEVKCGVLQQMLTQKLLSQQAVIDSVTVTDDEVTNEVDRRMRAFIQRAGGQERLEQFLNRSVLQYKDEIRPDVKEQLVANRMHSKITENIGITPLEVKRFFESIPKDSLPEYPTEVEVGEIVVYPKLTKAEKEQFRDKAEALRLRIKGGEDFATLARLYSQDPGSAPEGGDLGFFDRTAMVKEFTALAFKLKANELSPVFETDFGFHFLQVMERRGEQVRARHILIKMEAPQESLVRTKVAIDSIYQNVVDKKLPFSTAASMYSDNNDTKYNGGMMLNAENVSSRTTFIPTDKLDPSVFFAIDTMQVGTYSRPYEFTARDGKKGYRFVYLKSKTDPHRANLDQDFPKIKEIAFEDKIQREVSSWFEKRRLSTYIKVDPEFQTCESLKMWLPNETAQVN